MKKTTRMHSSTMHTVRCSGRLGGGSASGPRGVSTSGPSGGVSASSPRGCLPLVLGREGVYTSWADTPLPGQTPLPWVGTHPMDRHPPGQTPPRGQKPLHPVHARIHTHSCLSACWGRFPPVDGILDTRL